MPKSRDWAQRLISRLSFPADSRRLLEVDLYWDEMVCELYFAECDLLLFDRPVDGLAMARVAPELVRLVPEPSEWAGRHRLHELMVEALALLGRAFRVNGDHTGAERQYEAAIQLAESQRIGGLQIADVYRRLSVLRTCQRRYVEGFELACRAESDFRESGDAQRLSILLISKSYAAAMSGKVSLAVECCREVLALTPNPLASPKAGQLYHAATHNLAYCCLVGRVRDLSKAQAYVRMARRSIPKNQKSVPKTKLRWIEGRIMLRLGSTRRGEKVLLLALAELETLGSAFDAALVALEVCVLWRSRAAWRDVEKLSARIYKRFRELSGDSEALVALGQWVEATRRRQLTGPLIRQIQSKLEARMAPGSCCTKKS